MSWSSFTPNSWVKPSNFCYYSINLALGSYLFYFVFALVLQDQNVVSSITGKALLVEGQTI